MAERLRLCGEGEGLYEEKRSRFIAAIYRVASEDEARAYITQVRKKYPDARHHVWAWVLPDGSCRWSDDGEPGGTAGAPTADILKNANVFGALCVTTRYFGGTLLGSGGLVRAYSRAAQLALADAGVEEDPALCTLRVKVRWEHLDRAHRLLRELDAQTEADYNTDPENALLTATMQEKNRAAFIARLTELTAGRAAVLDE